AWTSYRRVGAQASADGWGLAPGVSGEDCDARKRTCTAGCSLVDRCPARGGGPDGNVGLGRGGAVGRARGGSGAGGTGKPVCHVAAGGSAAPHTISQRRRRGEL